LRAVEGDVDFHNKLKLELEGAGYDLLEDELKDLYSAEKQLTKAIPKMAKGARDASLKDALTAHLKETHGHVSRLERNWPITRHQTQR
jgi:ferritin-like metal-binding protein YciE